MAFFALPYQVLFHDTMAYGSQHHMVNLKLQNVARESLLFADPGDGQPPWQEQLQDILILTREAYSLNLAPVELGRWVAVLLSYEEPTRSTVRLCFRLVGDDGKPVACGYQTMILADRLTQELVPAPPLLARHLDADREDSLLERLTDPPFSERARCGGRFLKDLFPPEVRALGARVAAGGAPRAGAIVDPPRAELALRP